MSSKKSNVNAICLRMSDVDYHVMAIASTYYTDNNGKHVTKSEFCRQAINGVSKAVLKSANGGILDKVINNWNLHQAGREILESQKKENVVMEGADLP